MSHIPALSPTQSDASYFCIGKSAFVGVESLYKGSYDELEGLTEITNRGSKGYAYFWRTNNLRQADPHIDIRSGRYRLQTVPT